MANAILAPSTASLATATGLTGLDATTQLAIATWVRLPSGSTASEIFTQQNNAGYTDGYTLYLFAAMPRLRILNAAGTQVTFTASNVSAAMLTQRWTHVAVVVLGGNVVFYGNGMELSRFALAANAATIAGTRLSTVGGSPGAVGSPKNLRLHDLRVWGQTEAASVTPGSIRAAMRGRPAGETARWFAQGANGADYSGRGNPITMAAGVGAGPGPVRRSHRVVP